MDHASTRTATTFDDLLTAMEELRADGASVVWIRALAHAAGKRESLAELREFAPKMEYSRVR